MVQEREVSGREQVSFDSLPTLQKSGFPFMIQVAHRGKDCMINGKRIAVVFPAYNAEKTLEATVRELSELVDTHSGRRP
jgi:hypothetical protein